MQIGVVFLMLLTRMMLLMLLYLFGSSGFLYRVWPSICQILWWCSGSSYYYSLAINVISTFGLSIFWKTIRMIFLPFFTVFVSSSSGREREKRDSNVTSTLRWSSEKILRLCSYLFPTNRFTTWKIICCWHWKIRRKSLHKAAIIAPVEFN